MSEPVRYAPILRRYYSLGVKKVPVLPINSGGDVFMANFRFNFSLGADAEVPERTATQIRVASQLRFALAALCTRSVFLQS
jgi:hypothetical protein